MGYETWSIVRAAAASSPHMMSLMTRPSFPFSSDRRIGRPTIEGYWNSGKFYTRKSQVHGLPGDLGEEGAYLCRVANLEESGSSIQNCGIEISKRHKARDKRQGYLLEVPPCLQVVEGSDVSSPEEVVVDRGEVGGVQVDEF
jgi:hypothetical protein